MHSGPGIWTRRGFVRGLGASAMLWTVSGAYAEQLQQTPRQTAGPFYPDKLPLGTDNDLLLINDAITPAVGEVTHLTGRVRDTRGNPVRNAVVEIWQVDNNGLYLHSRSGGEGERDGNFQGFGRFLTDSRGAYYFRTIKPVAYQDRNFQRAPHIHVAVQSRGRETFTTQCYVKGDPLNARDGILNAIDDPKARASVVVDFAPSPDWPATELAAEFNIILGDTPSDA